MAAGDTHESAALPSNGPNTSNAPAQPQRPTDGVRMLDRAEWTERERQYHHQVDALIGDHRKRAAQHVSHPVEDFLFTYYSFRPAQLRRWHAGAGIGLRNAPERMQWRFHRAAQETTLAEAAGPAHGTRPTDITRPTDAARPADVTVVDTDAFFSARGTTVRFVQQLLAGIGGAAPVFGCFGLHEWAMLYQADERRHLDWPLRLGQQGTDEVVRSHQLRCTHFDAFRFFTPAATTRNLLAPTLDARDRQEQPGCLHASMDLYKWAYRLTPVIAGDLVLDCFRLALDIRAVDMRASPYDLIALGYRPIAIETPAGKNEYVDEQRRFADRAALLRARLLAALAIFPQPQQTPQTQQPPQIPQTAPAAPHEPTRR